MVPNVDRVKADNVVMKTVTLAGGTQMPAVGFGTWRVNGRRGYDALRAALEVGYRHIDTATMYDNETEVGRAVRDSGLAREEVFITTKVPADRAGRERQVLGTSLRALGTEYVNLWLIHWPPRGNVLVPMWEALLRARDEGLARAVGVSNFTTAQIDRLPEKPAVNQVPWSPFDHDPVHLAEAQSRGVVLEGYSPFKRSDLRNPVLAEVAAAHDVTPAQVILRWHLEHGIVVIPKSVTPARIVSNMDLFGFLLSDDEVARIDALSGT
jgi:2,5-diketo-D-gluconate reductase A